jgi:hypothetical protein
LQVGKRDETAAVYFMDWISVFERGNTQRIPPSFWIPISRDLTIPFDFL